MQSLLELRTHAREIFFAGLAAVDPVTAIKNRVQLRRNLLQVDHQSYNLDTIGKIVVLGCGKAAAPMALALEGLLGDRISSGAVVVKYGHGLKLKRIVVLEAGHPIPDEAGVRAAHQITQTLISCGERDLVFFLVSGGGSALLPYPADGLSIADKQRTTSLLLNSGATIAEVNAVRKHLSHLKGGQLARLAAPAKVVSLILSDVVGDAVEAIASGPTAPDSSTYAECLDILTRYRLCDRLPVAVIEHLVMGSRGEIAETPKDFSATFERVQNVIIANNRMAVSAARRRAEALGYRSVVFSDALEGESRIAARSFSTFVKKIIETDKPILCPACVISGGETTVTVRGNGVGGRNQEFALAAAIELHGVDKIVLLSAGTDGSDGPTDAAGAIIDGTTVERAVAMGLDPVAFLNENDSYHLLQAINDLFFTGPTMTNVMDLQVALTS